RDEDHAERQPDHPDRAERDDPDEQLQAQAA
ncbi:MAG: hypothetical protein H6Q90_5044, partial [Deltaproteobacteria bacterium]|nr:hypothetical protein [Deltaproteobacteria bacterium]